MLGLAQTPMSAIGVHRIIRGAPMSMLDKIEKLRDEAWQEAMASPLFATVRALDDAVAAAGGSRLFNVKALDAPQPLYASTKILEIKNVFDPGKASGQRLSQGDAAEKALRRAGPLPVGRLMEAAAELGAQIGGEKPLVSFRSTLSKDNRFYSVKRNGMFFWWLTGIDFPEGWMGPSESYDLPLDPDPDSNQKGGDRHAATTLTS